MKLLIVEDDEAIRKSEKTLCKMSNWEVQEASDGKRAIDILSKDSDFDLVILDWHIPEVTGRKVYKWIKRTYPDIPVLVITGDYVTEAEHILYKPFPVSVLLEKISLITEQLN
jgi:DNA-binding response OmpR family regulator